MSSKGVFDLHTMAATGLALVLVGVTLAIGAAVNSQLQTSALPTVQVKCEAITWSANATYAVAVYPYIKSVDYMYNGSVCGVAGSTSQLINPANYSTNGRQIYLAATGIDNFGNGIKYVNYTTWTGADRMVMENSTSSIITIASWLPIIAVVAAAGIIIAVLISSFKFGGY